MKSALITTTINVPTVLALYRKLVSIGTRFFVAMDKKTPDYQTWDLDDSFCLCMTPDYQKACNYECSELLGWNNDSRRNIALLEALKWGAEVIISIDDDMIPTGGEFDFSGLFEFSYDGLQLGAPKQWFDAGQFMVPPTKQRGLPPDEQSFYALPTHIVDARIGVAQGIILGVPDTGAAEAMTKRPFVTGASDILRNGFVVHPEAYAVFNSQITAFRRELAPAFAQFYNHQGRNTDIFASMLMRRIMQERGLYTYYGPPMGYHARAPRPLFKDLKAEMYGLEHIDEFAKYLQRAPLQGQASKDAVVSGCRILMDGFSEFSDELKEVAHAWYDDCEKVL